MVSPYDLEGKELQYRPEAKVNSVGGSAIRRPTVGEGGGEDGDAGLAERAVRARGDGAGCRNSILGDGDQPVAKAEHALLARSGS